MQNIKTVLFFLPILLAVSCSDLEFIIPESDEGKEMISFSVSSDEALATRAGFCGGDTFIAMRMQSNSKKGGAALYTKTTATATKDAINNKSSYSSVKFEGDQIRYWDDAHGQYSLLSVYAVAIPNAADDVALLKSKLADGGTGGLSATWGNNDKNTIDWTVSKEQTKDATDNNPVTASSSTIDKEDLVYSNNIQKNGKDGVYRWDFTTNKYVPDATGAANHKDGQMTFITLDNQNNPLNTPSSTSGKFDKGHLVFKHALSRITVTLESGDGFDKSVGSSFTLADPGVQFLQMYVHGTLTLPTGQWTLDTANPATVNTKPARQTEDTPVTRVFYKTVAQMLPSYEFKDNDDTHVMAFTIDGNTYYITQDMLFDALNKAANQSPDYGYDGTARKFTMMQGKNYQFKFRVNKRKVEVITASLVDWEDVTAADISMNNARIKLQLEERGTAQTSDVAFYMAEDNKTSEGVDDNYATYQWTTGYTNLNAKYKDGKWSTESFWETSRDFYHFRALMPAATAVTEDGSGDYATLASGSAYTDICWGAPMLDDGINEDKGSFKWLYGPTSGGFDTDDNGNIADGLTADPKHQIYKAIGATEDPVKLILFHVMSDLTFNIKTTNDADKVNFGDGSDAAHSTKIELVGYKAAGKVLIGNGLVTATGDAGTSTVSTTLSASKLSCNYGAVPQDLTAVKLYITTPDGNQYIIDLKDVKATTVSSENLANPYEQGSDGKYTLDRWYPGFRYTYNITLKKTGITNLQATVVNWETVTAEDETVTIK